MEAPVQTPYGNCYDKKCIKKYIDQGNLKDPLNSKPLNRNHDLVKNKALENRIVDFLKKSPWAFDQVDEMSDDYRELKFKILIGELLFEL